MRGADTFTESLFTMRKLEDFVPPDHPLRPIRAMVNQALVKMDRLFAGMYEPDIKGGRPSIAPEKLLRAMLLAKTMGRMRQVMVRGLKRVDQMFVLTMAAYNLTRMRTLGQIRLQVE